MWKKNMTADDAAQVIERFLRNESLYPQEWNDFVDTPQVDPVIDKYRRECEDLEHSFDYEGEPDATALARLQAIIERLRSGRV